MSIYFLHRSNYCQSALAKFAAAPCFVPPGAPSARPSDWDWGRAACFFAPGRPTKTENNIRHGQKAVPAHSGLLLLHLLVKQFDRSAGQLPESGRSLWRVAWTVLADTSWAWVSFMTISRHSFSTFAAISAIDTVAMRFLWSTAAATRSSISLFDNCL